MKPRFSLRALLAVMAVVALVCLWRARPGRVASQFNSNFTQVAGPREALQLCGLQSLETIDRWTIRDVRVGPFEPSPGMAGWLLNRRQASLKICVYDREAGFGSTDGFITASAWGVEPRMNGNWQGELPPLLQWFLQ